MTLSQVYFGYVTLARFHKVLALASLRKPSDFLRSSKFYILFTIKCAKAAQYSDTGPAPRPWHLSY